MLFYSTNTTSTPIFFEEALLRSLAPDGGLYVPQIFPRFHTQEIQKLIGKSLQEIGCKVFQKWFGDEIEHEALRNIVYKALNFPMPLKKVGPYYLMELFHGPTLSFKDIATRCLAHMLDYVLKKRGERITILVATSGDTGGAVAQAFGEIERVTVVVLYPKGKVSKLQEEQLTRVAHNVITLEVRGVFDDCQALVKKAFMDKELAHLRLTSANSINVGRLIPQSIHYIYAYTQLPKERLEFVVPSGNMGNITAGLFAAKMGFPFHSFIIACNKNDPVVRYYRSGQYQPQETITTLSNAMDIGNPSNFIRILELFHHNHKAFTKAIKATSIDDHQTIKTIKNVNRQHHYLLDPHTAVGWAAAEHVSDPHATRILIATASPVKFACEMNTKTGIPIDDSKEIAKLAKRKRRKYEIKNKYEDLKTILCDKTIHLH